METKCVRCGEEFAMNCMLPIAEMTEEGKIVYPNETEEQSVQTSVVLCLKCMAYANEGWINLVKIPNSDKFALTSICDEDGSIGLDFWEDRYRKGELTKDIEESLLKEHKTRKEVKKQKMKNSPLRIAIIVEENLKAFDKFKIDSQNKDKE